MISTLVGGAMVIWAASLAMAQTPAVDVAIQAVETFEGSTLPTVPRSNQPAEAAAWVSAMRGLVDQRTAAEDAVAHLADGLPARALKARVTTHLAALAAQGEQTRLTEARDSLAAALDADAVEAWLGVLTLAVETQTWGPPAERAKAWLVERDPALVDTIGFPYALTWRRSPCSERDLRRRRGWRATLAEGCSLLDAHDTQAALPLFRTLSQTSPSQPAVWLGLSQALWLSGADNGTAWTQAQTTGPRHPGVRWTRALMQLDAGHPANLDGRWPRSWRDDVAALGVQLP